MQGNRYFVDEMSQIKRLQRRIGRDRERRAPQAAKIDEAGALDRVIGLGRNSKVSDVMIRSQNLHGLFWPDTIRL